jgi:hypothetical protein
VVRRKSSGRFISVSNLARETRGYVAYFNIQTMSIRYPEVYRGTSSRVI